MRLFLTSCGCLDWRRCIVYAATQHRGIPAVPLLTSRRGRNFVRLRGSRDVAVGCQCASGKWYIAQPSGWHWRALPDAADCTKGSHAGRPALEFRRRVFDWVRSRLGSVPFFSLPHMVVAFGVSPRSTASHSCTSSLYQVNRSEGGQASATGSSSPAFFWYPRVREEITNELGVQKTW